MNEFYIDTLNVQEVVRYDISPIGIFVQRYSAQAHDNELAQFLKFNHLLQFNTVSMLNEILKSGVWLIHIYDYYSNIFHFM